MPRGRPKRDRLADALRDLQETAIDEAFAVVSGTSFVDVFTPSFSEKKEVPKRKEVKEKSTEKKQSFELLEFEEESK